MVCSHCGNEIGNSRICPYCGTDSIPSGQLYFMQDSRTVPVSYQEPVKSRKADKHLQNIEMYGLMSVILLAGIFIVELLQLFMMVG